MNQLVRGFIISDNQIFSEYKQPGIRSYQNVARLEFFYLIMYVNYVVALMLMLLGICVACATR